MSRAELDRALSSIKDLWTEVDVYPQLDADRRDAVAKKATVILQLLADEFDLQRSTKLRM